MEQIPSQPTSDGVTATARRLLPPIAVAVIAVTSAVSGLNIAIPSVAEDTGATQTELLWMVDAYTITLAGLLLAAGALGDRYGRRRILTIGLVLFALAALAAAMVDNPDLLIACRALMGAGAAMVLPSTLSIITTTLPDEQRASAVGLWVGLAGAGAVIGLFGTAILLEYFAWNSVFVLNAALATISLVASLALLPASRDEDPPRLDLLGAALALLAIVAVVFGLIEGPERGWSDPLVLAALAIGVLGVVALVVHERRFSDPMLDPHVFAVRSVQAGSISIAALFFAFFGFIFLVTQYLQFVAGLSPLEVAVALLPFPVVMIPLSRKTPGLAQRVGPNRLTAGGFGLLAVALCLLSTLGTDLSYVTLIAGLVALASGMAMISPPSTTAIVTSLPATKQGVASAISDTSREVGGAIGVAALGSILNAGYTAHLADAVPVGAPPQAVDTAESSIAAADALASSLGDTGTSLASAASQGFVDGMGNALLVAAAFAVLGGIHAYVRSPRRAETTRRSTVDDAERKNRRSR